MLCGLYEVDITPGLDCPIPGYFEQRLAAGVRDPLMARAAAFSNENGDSFIYISTDSVRVLAVMVEAIRKRVEQLTGVPGKNVMVAATHTHTGGPVPPLMELGTPEAEYPMWMARQAADAAVMAWNKRVPVKIGFAHAYEHHLAFVRRYYMKDGTVTTYPGYHPELIDRPAGEADPEIGIIKIEDMDGKLIGVITNFANHLDTVSGHRYCADFPGELHRVLKAVYGHDLVSMFMTGACGNVNHCDFMHRTAAYYWDKNNPHHIRMGRILAGHVIRALADTETHETEELAVELDSFTAVIRTPDPDEVAKAEAFLKEHPYVPVYTREGVPSEPHPHLVPSFSANSLLKVHNDPVKEVPFPVQTARIGNAAIASMPCEPFACLGLEIKARSTYDHTFICMLANGTFGYVADRVAFEQGGYETRISLLTKLAPETGYDMIDACIRLFEKMK